MTRVDLETVGPTIRAGGLKLNLLAWDLVAELRAAREVIKGTRSLLGARYWDVAQAERVDAAIDAYDEAVGS